MATCSDMTTAERRNRLAMVRHGPETRNPLPSSIDWTDAIDVASVHSFESTDARIDQRDRIH